MASPPWPGLLAVRTRRPPRPAGPRPGRIPCPYTAAEDPAGAAPRTAWLHCSYPRRSSERRIMTEGRYPAATREFAARHIELAPTINDGFERCSAGQAARAGAAVVVVVGPANEATARRVTGWVRRLVGAGVSNLVIDVSAARDCDKRLLTVLARVRAELVNRGGTLKMTGVALPQFLAALHTLAPDEVFMIYDALRPARAQRRRTSTTTAPGSQAHLPMS